MNFCPPERSVSAARSAAIKDFAQKRFELRSVIATNQKPRLARFFYVDFQALATVYMVMLALVLSNILSAEAATKP